MSVITSKLDQLHEIRNEIGRLEAEIRQATPDLHSTLDILECRANELEKSIKQSAKYVPPSQAHTLRGAFLKLVWRVRKTWKVDQANLADLVEKYQISQEDLEKVITSQDSSNWAITK